MLRHDVLTNDVQVQEAVTGGRVSEVNSASGGKLVEFRCQKSSGPTNLYSPDSLPLMLLTMRRDVSLSLVWKVALSPKWLGLDQMRAKERSVSPLTSTLQTLSSLNYLQIHGISTSTTTYHLTFRVFHQFWIKLFNKLLTEWKSSIQHSSNTWSSLFSQWHEIIKMSPIPGLWSYILYTWLGLISFISSYFIMEIESITSDSDQLWYGKRIFWENSFFLLGFVKRISKVTRKT